MGDSVNFLYEEQEERLGSIINERSRLFLGANFTLGPFDLFYLQKSLYKNKKIEYTVGYYHFLNGLLPMYDTKTLPNAIRKYLCLYRSNQEKKRNKKEHWILQSGEVRIYNIFSRSELVYTFSFVDTDSVVLGDSYVYTKTGEMVKAFPKVFHDEAVLSIFFRKMLKTRYDAGIITLNDVNNDLFFDRRAMEYVLKLCAKFFWEGVYAGGCRSEIYPMPSHFLNVLTHSVIKYYKVSGIEALDSFLDMVPVSNETERLVISYFRAKALRYNREYEKALEILDKILRGKTDVNDGIPHIMTERAMCFCKNKNEALGQIELYRVLKLFPGYSRGYFKLAKCFIRQGDVYKTLTLLNRADTLYQTKDFRSTKSFSTFFRRNQQKNTDGGVKKGFVLDETYIVPRFRLTHPSKKRFVLPDGIQTEWNIEFGSPKLVKYFEILNKVRARIGSSFVKRVTHFFKSGGKRPQEAPQTGISLVLCDRISRVEHFLQNKKLYRKPPEESVVRVCDARKGKYLGNWVSRVPRSEEESEEESVGPTLEKGSSGSGEEPKLLEVFHTSIQPERAISHDSFKFIPDATTGKWGFEDESTGKFVMQPYTDLSFLFKSFGNELTLLPPKHEPMSPSISGYVNYLADTQYTKFTLTNLCIDSQLRLGKFQSLKTKLQDAVRDLLGLDSVHSKDVELACDVWRTTKKIKLFPSELVGIIIHLFHCYTKLEDFESAVVLAVVLIDIFDFKLYGDRKVVSLKQSKKPGEEGHVTYKWKHGKITVAEGIEIGGTRVSVLQKDYVQMRKDLYIVFNKVRGGVQVPECISGSKRLRALVRKFLARYRSEAVLSNIGFWDVSHSVILLAEVMEIS